MDRQTTSTGDRDAEVRAIVRQEIAAAVPAIKASFERAMLQRQRRAF